MEKNSFRDLYYQYRIAESRVMAGLANLDNRVARINQHYSPRHQFDLWRSSNDGKTWKREQHKKQKHQCANPNCSFVHEEPEYFEIDHIKPIKTHPHLATDEKNLQLLCSPCNRRKGASEKKFQDFT